MQNFTRSVLCTVTAAYLAITGSVIAGGDKNIEVIKVLRDDDNITVNLGDNFTAMIPDEALADKEMLRSYLGQLDDETLELVLDVLSGMDNKGGHPNIVKLSKFLDRGHGQNRRVLVLGKDHVTPESLDSEEHAIHVAVDAHVSPQVLVKEFKDGQGIAEHIIVDIDSVEAHQKTIISLLEKGDFSQEQLHAIQQVLDSKR